VLKSCPSDLRTADLKESISAVTWGALQMVDGLAGAVTDPPGKAVETPGAGVSEDGVPINRVDVGRARKVGVAAGACEADSTQPARRIEAIRKTAKFLVFMIISSLDNYIPLRKRKRQDHDPGAQMLCFC
jgi:hypothetical protein